LAEFFVSALSYSNQQFQKKINKIPPSRIRTGINFPAGPTQTGSIQDENNNKKI
jgi:hypothetical protein